jgi:hypothetical protein
MDCHYMPEENGCGYIAEWTFAWQPILNTTHAVNGLGLDQNAQHTQYREVLNGICTFIDWCSLSNGLSKLFEFSFFLLMIFLGAL